MTVTYGFYDSVSSDRLYNALQMGSIFDGIINDGVFGTIGDSLIVVQNTGMGIYVGTGRAWFNHTWTLNDADLSLTVDSADATYPRIDIVALEINSEVATRANSFKIVKGTPASSPTPPTLTNTGTIHQYPLAHIYVGAGVTSIYQANITNKIGTTACPLVTGVLSVLTIDTILSQWDSEFDIWFDAMKDQLTTDAAGNLQTQINTINDNIDDIEADIAQNKLLRFFVHAIPHSSANPHPSWHAYGGYLLYPNAPASYNNFVGSFCVPKDYVSGMTVYGVWGDYEASDQQIYAHMDVCFSREGDGQTRTIQNFDDSGLLKAGAVKNWPSIALTSPESGDIVRINTYRNGEHTNDTGTGSNTTFIGWVVEYYGHDWNPV